VPHASLRQHTPSLVQPSTHPVCDPVARCYGTCTRACVHLYVRIYIYMCVHVCVLQGNSADVFGSDVYMESWVATPAYFNPFPTSARESLDWRLQRAGGWSALCGVGWTGPPRRVGSRSAG
jgi:hypothetical protein